MTNQADFFEDVLLATTLQECEEQVIDRFPTVSTVNR